SNAKPQQEKLTFKSKKRARSDSPLFGEMSDSDIEIVSQQPSLSTEKSPKLVEGPEKKRRRAVTTGTTEFATLTINDSDSDLEAGMTKENDINDIEKTDAAAAAGNFSYDFGYFDNNIVKLSAVAVSSIFLIPPQ
ncbi:hypothetical protein BDR06DRAFT_977980, partial [Suillus hirtellus]